MLFTHFSISFILFSYNVSLIQANPSTLQLGENPVDSFYHLPEGAKWNGVGHFSWTHFLTEAGEHDAQCKQNRAITTCIHEVGRRILVKDGHREFPSHCWYEDCEINVNTPNLTGLFVDMYSITDAPLLNFDSPPFYPDKVCLGSQAPMLAPGNKRYNLRLYNIYLLIKLTRTTLSNGTVVDVTDRTVKAQGILDEDRCNSFVTHKYISG